MGCVTLQKYSRVLASIKSRVEAFRKSAHRGETIAIRAARPIKMAELKEIERIVSKWYPDIAK